MLSSFHTISLVFHSFFPVSVLFTFSRSRFPCVLSACALLPPLSCCSAADWQQGVFLRDCCMEKMNTEGTYADTGLSWECPGAGAVQILELPDASSAATQSINRSSDATTPLLPSAEQKPHAKLNQFYATSISGLCHRRSRPSPKLPSSRSNRNETLVPFFSLQATTSRPVSST